MKFRIDFVTNSSSASYISVQYLALPRTEGQKESFPGVIISKSTSIESDDEQRPQFEKKAMPHLVKRFVIDSGKPITVEDLFASIKQRREFVDYINRKYGTALEVSDFLIWNINHSIGFGESVDVDMNEVVKDILQGMHPNVKKVIESTELPSGIWQSYSVRNATINSVDMRVSRLFFSPIEQEDGAYGWTDASSEFYELFYKKASCPGLPSGMIRNKLLKIGLNEKEIQQISERDLQILCVGESFRNDVIVFKEPKAQRFYVMNIVEFRNCYLKGKPPTIERYFGIAEDSPNEEIEQKYKMALSKKIIDKYSDVSQSSTVDMNGYFENGIIPEKYKSVIKKTIDIGGKPITFICKPKAELNKFEKLYAELAQRKFYSCNYLLENPDTAWEDLPEVPVKIAEIKLLEFLKVFLLYLKDENLIRIGKNAEKKSNGSLYKNRVNKLAWCEVAAGSRFYALRALNTDDLTITIEIENLEYRSSEIMKYSGIPHNDVVLKTLNGIIVECEKTEIAAAPKRLIPRRGMRKSDLEIPFDKPKEITINGKEFVLTGIFLYVDVNQLDRDLVRQGAIIKGSVTKAVHYLIVGGAQMDQNVKDVELGGTKVITALRYRQDGIGIQIISEETLLLLCGDVLLKKEKQTNR